MLARSLFSSLSSVRSRAGRVVTDAAWAALAQASQRIPSAQPERHGVERVRDLRYRDSGLAAHTLDIYRPERSESPERRDGPLPVVLYVHGGSFRILSKDSHWMMSLAFARRGYLVFNINYRLAPENPFPAAVEDECAALVWVLENAARYGGDPSRLVLAGESAGANLVTSLAIAASYPRPEPWARRVWDAGARPLAVLPACGILQVSDVDRFGRQKRLSAYLQDRLREMEEGYLGPTSGRPSLDLADPLVFLEQAGAPERPLPAFFVGVGTRDLLIDDTRRLKVALDRLGVTCDARYYPGEIHAFQAMLWREQARNYWREAHAFLDRALLPSSAVTPAKPE